MLIAPGTENQHFKSRSYVLKKNLAVWWLFPCQATSGIFREIAGQGYSVDVFLFKGMTEGRAKLGWKIPDYGKCNVTVLPESQKERVSFIDQFPFDEYDSYVVSGFYGFPELTRVLTELINRKRPYCILTEAPFNQFRGFKRLMKYFYLQIVLPVKERRYAKNAEFVCCMSGAAPRCFRWLRHFGFRKERIFPYGYFSEQHSYEGSGLESVSTPPLIVCTGYHRRNKGQMLLLGVLNNLAQKGVSFQCRITGYGPETQKLQDFINNNKLNESVELVGTLSKEELHKLMADADIFAAPGYEEPWGIRINEAVQAVCPTIISDRIGACELIECSGGGYMFHSGSEADLERKLALMLTDENLLKAMKKRLLMYRDLINPCEPAKYLSLLIEKYILNGSVELPDKPAWLRKANDM